MKGTIIDFDEIEKSGLILAEDGNRYLFELNNWKSKNKIPEIDAEVDFVVNELNQATAIYLTAYSQHSNASQFIASNNDQIQAEENYGFLDWSMKCLKNYVWDCRICRRARSLSDPVERFAPVGIPRLRQRGCGDGR